MKLHYSQTIWLLKRHIDKFYYLMKLHYSQTPCRRLLRCHSFTTLWNYTTLKPADMKTRMRAVLLPYEITLLSNIRLNSSALSLFYYLMKLHYSQTRRLRRCTLECFTTLWNYTTLKLCYHDFDCGTGFTTLWNYTTLKPIRNAPLLSAGFTTLWNYTTLKRFGSFGGSGFRFTTLWNYTTLKR